MAQLGVDYANTDTINKPGVDGFTSAKSAGARIVIPRGVYGRPADGQTPVYLDSYWARDKDDIVAAGLNRSSYLFVCVPTTGHPAPDPDVQVAAFYGYVQLNKPVVGKKPHDMVPFFDVEMASDVLSADEYYDWILKVAKGLRSAFGAWPGMYTSDRVWTEVLKNHAAGQLINCPLWIAKPWPWAVKTPVHLDGAPGYNPTTIPEFGDATNFVLYQYQGDGLGMPGFTPGAVDMNLVHYYALTLFGTATFAPRHQAETVRIVASGGFAAGRLVSPTASRSRVSRKGLSWRWRAGR
jgi:hypothetical protein